jgi:hypothetical protein
MKLLEKLRPTTSYAYVSSVMMILIIITQNIKRKLEEQGRMDNLHVA